ncbi:MAG: DUF1553 domain-containing protein [Pirellulales bacterium]
MANTNRQCILARVEVNRIWGQLLGRGIVEPVDDFRDSNPPSNRELLDALAKDFREKGFDRKAMMRTILSSNTYQADYRGTPFNQSDVKYFSHAQPRLLGAEQLLDAVGAVTGLPEKFAGLARRNQSNASSCSRFGEARIFANLWSARADHRLPVRTW